MTNLLVLILGNLDLLSYGFSISYPLPDYGRNGETWMRKPLLNVIYISYIN